MSKLKKPKTYSELRKEWYQKLKKDGFKDIEQDDDKLIRPSYDFARERTQPRLTPVFEYYYMAEHFLNNYKFESKFDQIVWEYHVNGLGVRDIADTLNKLKNKKLKTNRTTVWQTIKKLSTIMKSTHLIKSRKDPNNDLN